MISISDSLLTWVLVAEAALLGLAVPLLIGLHLSRWWYLHWSTPLVVRGEALLMAIAEDRSVPETNREWLLSLPRRVQTKLFVHVGRSLEGAGRARLNALARGMGLVAHAETRCRSRLWWRRLHGARLLSLVGGGEAAVPRLLRDRHREVRAQAAEWAVTHPDPPVIAELLDLLSDPWGLCRFSAQDSLERLGRVVEGPLVQYLSTGRATEGALQVAASIPGPRLRSPAVALVHDSPTHIRALAATLLAALGDREDVALLIALLDDPAAVVRAAATQGLGRLGHWPASPKVSALLRDPAWAVRREAALALRAMGAPGTLLLRRALSSDDRFAADMAKQVLGLPGAAE